MNRDNVIKKFIEKCGPLKALPQYHFATGEDKQNIGMTTEVGKFFELMKVTDIKFTDYNSRIKEGFLHHFQIQDTNPFNTWSVDYPITCVEMCCRFLQNAPFKDIRIVFSPGYGLPIAFSRTKCDISILLAPIMMKVPVESEKRKELRKFKFSLRWIVKLPDTTFWLCEVPAGESTRNIVKCKNCGEEKEIDDWKSLRDSKHPECYCSCDTWGDECGCRKKREGQRYDRFRGKYTELPTAYDIDLRQAAIDGRPQIKANPVEYLYWHRMEIRRNGLPSWLGLSDIVDVFCSLCGNHFLSCQCFKPSLRIQKE